MKKTKNRVTGTVAHLAHGTVDVDVDDVGLLRALHTLLELELCHLGVLPQPPTRGAINYTMSAIYF